MISFVGMRVFVTRGSGFVGLRLFRILFESEAQGAE
jgi:hypothetical protein